MTKSRASLSLAILVAAVCLLSAGLWHASVPLGDEAGYIRGAAELLRQQRLTTNLYKLNYMLLLRFISSDPITVHFICRFYTSVLSVICMFLFLQHSRAVSDERALLLVSLFWACCRLVTPRVQFGNINLFALNLVFPALVLVMQTCSLNRVLFLLLSLFWAAQTRLEYYAPLLLLSLYFCWTAVRFIREEGLPAARSKASRSTAVLFVLVCGSVVAAACTREMSCSIDEYLLLGLSQCYTSLHAKLNPGPQLSTMVEYSELVDEVFGAPSGFLAAFRHNPVEVVKYLALNGAINSVVLVPGLLRHRNLFMPESLGKRGEIVEIVAILVLALAGTWLHLRSRAAGWRATQRWLVALVLDRRTILLAALCTAASVSVLLHIPDARYWITCAPALFVWLVWAVAGLFSPLKRGRWTTVALVLVGLWLCHPLLLDEDGNGPLLRRVRALGDELGRRPVVLAGLYPYAVGTYAFTCDYRAVTATDMAVDQIRSGDYDFIVVDTYLRSSAFWRRHEPFMISFEADPGLCSYRLVGSTDGKYATTIYVTEQKSSMEERNK